MKQTIWQVIHKLFKYQYKGEDLPIGEDNGLEEEADIIETTIEEKTPTIIQIFKEVAMTWGDSCLIV